MHTAGFPRLSDVISSAVDNQRGDRNMGEDRRQIISLLPELHQSFRYVTRYREP